MQYVIDYFFAVTSTQHTTTRPSTDATQNEENHTKTTKQLCVQNRAAPLTKQGWKTTKQKTRIDARWMSRICHLSIQ
jgi:hypothetical protein